MRGVLVASFLIVLCSVIPAQVIPAQPASASESSNAPPAGLLKYSPPQFPVGLRGIMAGDAQVVLAITVNGDGQVVDSVALQATQKEFADAAIEAVMEWQFAAAKPTGYLPRREVMEFAFHRDGVVTTLQHVEAAREGFNLTTRHPDIRTVKVTELDAPPQRLTAQMARVSTAQLDTQGKQPLVVNFVIDTTGKVRVPVATVSDPQLAQSVLDAVKQWRYAPPTQDGLPVLVEVTRSMQWPSAARSY